MEPRLSGEDMYEEIKSPERSRQASKQDTRNQHQGAQTSKLQERAVMPSNQQSVADHGQPMNQGILRTMHTMICNANQSFPSSNITQGGRQMEGNGMIVQARAPDGRVVNMMLNDMAGDKGHFAGNIFGGEVGTADQAVIHERMQRAGDENGGGKKETQESRVAPSAAKNGLTSNDKKRRAVAPSAAKNGLTSNDKKRRAMEHLARLGEEVRSCDWN